MGSTGKMKRASRSLRPKFCRDLIFVFLMLSKGKCGKSGNNNKQQHQKKEEKTTKNIHICTQICISISLYVLIMINIYIYIHVFEWLTALSANTCACVLFCFTMSAGVTLSKKTKNIT